MENSLLELWGYDFDYSSLDRPAILDMVTRGTVNSAVTGNPVFVRGLLGGVQEEGGRVVAAQVDLVTTQPAHFNLTDL
jgi:hypothetical protein